MLRTPPRLILFPYTTLFRSIKENLVAERIAIDHYRELIRFFGDDDPATRLMLQKILAVEEEHANDMHDLLRSEEHTSELQSPDHLVCRLLLETKKPTDDALL